MKNAALFTAIGVSALLAVGVMVSVGSTLFAIARPAYAQPNRGVAEAAEASDAVKQAVEQVVEALKDMPDLNSEEEWKADGSVVKFSGDIEIPKDRIVEGDVVAIGGSASILGTVKGNVVAIDGDIALAEGASVQGDVVSVGGEVKRATGVTVGGSSVQIGAPWAASLVDRLIGEVTEQAPETDAEDVEAETTTESAETVPAAADTVEPEAAPAEPTDLKQVSHLKEIVRFGQPVTVGKDDVVDGSVVAFGSPVRVLGVVNGDAVAFGGPVEIEGTINGSVTAFGGPVKLRDNARVTGDVVAMGGPLVRADGAQVSGETTSMGGILDGVKLGWEPPPIARVGGWFANTIASLVIVLVLALVMPKHLETIADKVAEEPGQALLHGIVGALLFVPIFGVLFVLIITWLVIPLYVAATIALGAVGMIGMQVLIGRQLANQLNQPVSSVVGLALIGFAAVCVLELIKLLPLIGMVAGVGLLAIGIIGFGGALMTGFGTDPTGTWLRGRRDAAHMRIHRRMQQRYPEIQTSEPVDEKGIRVPSSDGTDELSDDDGVDGLKPQDPQDGPTL